MTMEPEEKSCVQFNEQNLPDTDGDHDENSPVIASLSNNTVSPHPAKRATRQWAAWTRQEEESFFSALRQVGKNFHKITCRVQSKNKDQVRHYYYRLVRRMNKLLGPGLCLDAKNSKDTNAAMLRWWSLLEKYSCKASKLHLKPRRFKIFIEALEHQLMKDRKKNVKKQSSQGDNCASPTSTLLYQNKTSGNDLRAVKTVATDGQIVEKPTNGKGSSTRRSSNLGITKISNKGDSSPTKSTRQRRKTGVVSTAAIKKWEKAAMAGVSLVADAAEHVDRTFGQTQGNFLDGLTMLSAQAVDCTMEKTQPGTSGHVQANSLIKLKLQLFPIDDNTRKALEMDKHNPHLELTLSTRKKISSVVEHMGRKWGGSCVALGELMLFPFNIQRENLLGCQRWTRDSVATAAEVYAMIGSPPVFRLRYGWIVALELQSAIPVPPAADPESSLVDEMIAGQPIVVPVEKIDKMGKQFSYSSDDQCTEGNSTAAACGKANTNNVENHLSEPRILLDVPPKNGSMSSKIKNVVDNKLEKSPTLSAGEWADSLTNVSAGDLLPEVPDNSIANCMKIPVQNSRCVEEISFSCDSFDAAIAAHISSQYKSSFTSRPSPHLSSIWDAEETCDEFTFRKSAVASKQDLNPSMTGDRCAKTSSADINDRGLPEEAMAVDVSEVEQMNECPSEPYEAGNPSKDLNTLMDIYWPESLGPLELDVPSCKYYSEDLILSDSLSGLNRLIASSLDAFQHCPLFGLDDKGPPAAAGVQRGSNFAGKIGTGGDTAGVRSLQV